MLSQNRMPAMAAFLLSAVFFTAVFAKQLPAAPVLQDARVTAVNDGDTVTITMDQKEFRTRLIGIDAPELGQEPWGERTRGRLRGLLRDARWRVRVERDIEQFDKYNRLLVYLWTGDGKLINEELLAEGLAVLFTLPPNSKYSDRFRKAQQRAREKRLGIWGADGLKERPRDYKKKHPRQ